MVCDFWCGTDSGGPCPFRCRCHCHTPKREAPADAPPPARPGFDPEVTGVAGRYTLGGSVIVGTVASATMSEAHVVVNGAFGVITLQASAGWAFERSTDSAPTGSYQAAIDDIRWLAAARAEYVSATGLPTAEEYHELSHVERRVYEEVTAAEHVADILAGTNDGAGWLPSWKWDTWRERTAHGESTTTL